jgi:hypothetical protein
MIVELKEVGGQTVSGELNGHPSIGKPFVFGDIFKTDKVIKILDKGTFITENKVYRYKLHDGRGKK